MALWKWVQKNKTDEEAPVLPFPADWLERFDETTLERLAIITVDGGLSDEKALKVMRLL